MSFFLILLLQKQSLTWTEKLQIFLILSSSKEILTVIKHGTVYSGQPIKTIRYWTRGQPREVACFLKTRISIPFPGQQHEGGRGRHFKLNLISTKKQCLLEKIMLFIFLRQPNPTHLGHVICLYKTKKKKTARAYLFFWGKQLKFNKT